MKRRYDLKGYSLCCNLTWKHLHDPSLFLFFFFHSRWWIDLHPHYKTIRGFLHLSRVYKDDSRDNEGLHHQNGAGVKVRVRAWRACESESATALIALFTDKKNAHSLAIGEPTCCANLNVCAFTVCVCAWAILCGCVPHVRMNREIRGGGARRTTVHSSCIIDSPTLSHNLCFVH